MTNPILTLKGSVKPPLREREASVEAFTIYGPNQIEYPGMYVVRRWTAFGGDPVPDIVPYCFGVSLHAARLGIPFGLARIKRSETDDPSIIETWI